MALTEKQKRFCDEYLIDLNATRAYKSVYTTVKNDAVAATNGGRLLKQEDAAAYIALRQGELRKKTEITQERVLEEYAKLAFFDPRRLFDADGKPLPVTELDEATAAAVAGLEVSDLFEGTGANRKAVGTVKKYKLADKKGALNSLAKHLGMFTEKVEHCGEISIELAEELKEWAK